MKHPKRFNSAQFINLHDERLTSHGLSRVNFEKIQIRMSIIDFKLKDLSYREIQDIILRTYSTTISKEFIAQTLVIAGKRAKWLNHYYDALVIPKIKVLECDEVFQGQNTCLFGAADKWSSYLVSLEFLQNRGHEAIKAQFEKFDRYFGDLQIIITDGLTTYPGVLDDILNEIIHLQCQVHAMRNIYKEQDIFKRKARVARRYQKKLENKVKTNKNLLAQKRSELRNYERQLTRWIKSRNSYYAQYGIKRYSKKSTWTVKQHKISNKLNYLRASIRSKKRTIKNLCRKRTKLAQDLDLSIKKYSEKQQINLQTGRLVARFKALLATSSRDYVIERPRYEQILQRSRYKIAPILRKFLQNHPRLFSLQLNDIDDLLSPNYRNSNTIERIFSLFRCFLNKIKTISKTETGYALLELLRFRHNFTPPKTGIHNRESPLKQVGIHSKYDNYIDALFQIPMSFTLLQTQLIEECPHIQRRLPPVGGAT
ncbi:MAG: hypothetical protein ACTSR4_07010 [Candidatus Hodarchaeales archaeon]